MTLDQITPHPVSSLLVRNWKAEVPSWLILAAITIPALILDWQHKWVLFVIAIIAAYAADAGMSRLREHLRIKDALTPPLTFPDPPPIDIVARTERWKTLVGDSIKSFVLFSYGTCVVSVDAKGDPAEDAKTLLQQFGHAIPGTPSADMLVYELPDTNGFVVGGQHPNILTFVPRDMVPSVVPTDQLHTFVAFRGRDLRVLDTFTLNPILTEVVYPDGNET